MDAVSECVTELAFQNGRLPIVLNIVHPRPTEWNTIIKLIGDALVLQKKLDSPLGLVSFQEWFSILEAHAKSSNPAEEVRIVCVFLFSFLSTLFYILTVYVLHSLCPACY
jgi:uncharacterized protein YhhL (DUF1145 family)